MELKDIVEKLLKGNKTEALVRFNAGEFEITVSVSIQKLWNPKTGEVLIENISIDLGDPRIEEEK